MLFSLFPENLSSFLIDIIKSPKPTKYSLYFLQNWLFEKLQHSNIVFENFGENLMNTCHWVKIGTFGNENSS